LILSGRASAQSTDYCDRLFPALKREFLLPDTLTEAILVPQPSGIQGMSD
jgi:hypothetical protein